ncbi:hypothetical protein GCM10009534_47460 [Kribbella sandramycini]
MDPVQRISASSVNSISALAATSRVRTPKGLGQLVVVTGGVEESTAMRRDVTSITVGYVTAPAAHTPLGRPRAMTADPGE